MKADDTTNEPLAHSPPQPSGEGDPYVRHVSEVCRGAKRRAEEMLHYATPPRPDLLDAITEAAVFHDLGKLDPDNQAALRRGRDGRLPWDHVDAGVACLSSASDWMAAWLIRSHHAPGLPENQEHFNPDNVGRRLRGRRREDHQLGHEEQIQRTDCHLASYLSLHERVVGAQAVEKRRPVHGLTMRLALSCLIDADHSDTALWDTGHSSPEPPAPRWSERFEALCDYVASLPEGDTEAERARNRRRGKFFDACRHARLEHGMVACEGPVGIGKTTAVTAFLLSRAMAEKPQLRRLFIVAPYTNILKQTADTLRKALVLPGEMAEQVIAEHHHRADFERPSDRDLAVLWQAPIILTTAVSFFETLAACTPGALRKLHALPGSTVFIDEAHAALPTRLWPQNWLWLTELAERWSCHFVFASGSLARFWEDKEIVKQPATLPDLLPAAQAEDIAQAERSRVQYAAAGGGEVLDVERLIAEVQAARGPRLVILNTVQNAAVVAQTMRERNLDVLHLSTALTPGHRERILDRVKKRLADPDADWALVATSCVEAGVDLSFASAFRERFSTASILQVAGRVNRHGEYDQSGGGLVYDFALDGNMITQHPAAQHSAPLLRGLVESGELNRGKPADLVTQAMREELRTLGGIGHDALWKAEDARNYPQVSKCGRVIDADTRLVVIDGRLREDISNRQPIAYDALLRGSVQMWVSLIHRLRLLELPGRAEVYDWPYEYDADFLGYMKGLLADRALVPLIV